MIVLPLPPIELKVNRTMGQHWAVAQKLKVSYQWACADAWVKAGRPKVTEKPTHLTVAVYLGYRQRCDAVDALSWIKSGLDALSGRAWHDDGSNYLNPVTVIVGRDSENPRLELTW